MYVLDWCLQLHEQCCAFLTECLSSAKKNKKIKIGKPSHISLQVHHTTELSALMEIPYIWTDQQGSQQPYVSIEHMKYDEHDRKIEFLIIVHLILTNRNVNGNMWLCIGNTYCQLHWLCILKSRWALSNRNVI